MKLRFKVASIAGTALAIAAFATAPLSANAATVGVYEGTTGVLQPGVPLTGGTGTFTFSAACVGVSTNGTVAVNQGACVTASGTYANTVCGTGTADGSGAVTSAGLVGPGLSESATFHIQFVAGVGAITGSANGGTLVGTAQLIPTQGNCVSPVTQFTVAGVLAATN